MCMSKKGNISIDIETQYYFITFHKIKISYKKDCTVLSSTCHVSFPIQGLL